MHILLCPLGFTSIADIRVALRTHRLTLIRQDDDVRTAADDADGVVVVAASAENLGNAQVARIAGLALNAVLVIPLSPDALRRWDDLPVRSAFASVVWMEEVPERLAHEVLNALPGSLRARLGNALLARHTLSPLMDRAIREICFGVPPPTSVAALADRLRVPRTALYYHWLASSLEQPLKSFLDHCHLLEAVQLRSGGLPWSGVATALGIHRRRLERKAMRICGCPLPDLSSCLNAPRVGCSATREQGQGSLALTLTPERLAPRRGTTGSDTDAATGR